MTTETQTTATVVETTPAVVAPAKAPKASKAKAAPKAPKAPKADAPAKGLQFEEGTISVPFSLLDEGVNVTRPEGRGDVSDLAKSIAALGQQTPVWVQRVGDRFLLAAGFRRVEAIRSLGLEAVKAQVLLDGSETGRALANVVENENARLEIGPLGRVAGYEALRAAGYSITEIAGLTGRARDFINDHLKLTKACEEIRAALALGEDEEGATTWGVARQLVHFPITEQPALLKKVGHLSVAEARIALAKIRAGAEAKGSEGSEGSEGADEVETDETEGGLSAEKVAKATATFMGLVGDAIVALRGEASPEKVANILAKGLAQQEKTMRRLCGDEVIEAAMAAQAEKLAK